MWLRWGRFPVGRAHDARHEARPHICLISLSPALHPASQNYATTRTPTASCCTSSNATTMAASPSPSVPLILPALFRHPEGVGAVGLLSLILALRPGLLGRGLSPERQERVGGQALRCVSDFVSRVPPGTDGGSVSAAAFAVQDMDGDGAISRADLARYLSRAMPCDIRADIEEAVMDGLELAEGGGAEKEEKGEKEGEREAPSPGAAASPTLGKDKASAPPTTGPTDKDAVTAAQLLRVVDGAFADLHLDAETGVLDRHAFIQACNLTAYQKYVISFV